MNPVIEISLCIIEAIVCIAFLIKYFGFKKNTLKSLKTLLFTLAAIIIEIFTLFCSANELIYTIIFVAVFTVLSTVFLNGKTYEHFSTTTMIYSLIITINMSTAGMFCGIFNVSYSNINNNTNLIRIFMLVYTKIILVIILQIFINASRTKHIYLKKIEYLMLALTFVINATVCLTIRDIMLVNFNSPFRFLYIMGCMICLDIIILCCTIRISRISQKTREMEILKIQLNQQEKSMLEVDRRYEEISKIRHDMKNYVACAIALAENKDYKELIKYLNDYSDTKLEKYRNYITTESRVVNAVINSKLSLAQENEISIDCVITGKIGNIREIDISILLSNLLDNAIEQCEKKNDKARLKIEMYNKNAFLCVKIKNTCTHNVLLENPTLETTKEDKGNHGLGLKSVQDIVSKYSGSIDFSFKHDEFIVTAILCCQ